MNRERQIRKIGEKILLGNVEYQIKNVIGFGGSSIVYRAVYRDELNRDSFHQVLIKELFPFSWKGEVWRDEEGCIVTDDRGIELMQDARESFLQGNQANLELLLKDPEQISGNLNSFEAYGTCYSVLTVHGGQSLEQLLEEDKYTSLAAAADVMLKLLDALECFHKENILHLDISPDNILVLKRQALLIDYNSTWKMDAEQSDCFFFSEKEGYSAPEIYLRDYDGIGPQTDLYSVCAVFFRMVTGRKLDMEEVMGKGLRRSFPKSLKIFQDEPVTASFKTVEILTKGLNIIGSMRYQSIDALRQDILELIRRIEGKGISASAIWENSRTQRMAWKQKDGAYLSRNILMEDPKMGGEVLSEQECFRQLCDGACILLKGTGGMGKTQYLYRLWGEGVKRYHPQAPVLIYIPLEDYQQTQGASEYIRHFILRNLKFSEETNSMEDALHELNHLFAAAGKKSPKILLLLDGLNEAGSQRQNLLREIEELGQYDGVGILVSDRTDSVKQYGLSDFRTASLMPLTEKTVVEELDRFRLECPKEKKLRELLSNPMMLYLYRSASMMSVENGGKELWKTPENLEELVDFYIENLQRLQKRRDSGDESRQLLHDYLLEHLLPAIARELEKRKKTILSMEELYILASRDYKNMKSKLFGLAFPKYMGKSRLILGGISNDREWFDYAVSEQLIGQMNLMEQTAEGNFGLIHDNFTGYFADKWADNQKIWQQYHRKYVIKRAAIGVMVLFLLAGGGAAAFRIWGPSDRTISEADRKEIGNVTRSLNSNAGCWNGIMKAQYKILETADHESVYDNTPEGREALLSAIDSGEKKVTSYYNEFFRMPYSEGAGERSYNYLDTAVDIFPGLSKETLSRVYMEPDVQKTNVMLCMDYLKKALCEEDSEMFYSDIDDRKNLLKAYRQYLDGASEYYYLIYNEIYIGMDDEKTQADLKEQVVQTMSCFPPEGMKWSLGEKTETELKDLMLKVTETDDSDMKIAQLNMAKYRFPVREMEWPF